MSTNLSHTANHYLQTALRLMQSSPPQYFVASCVLRFLFEKVQEEERPKLARLVVQCGVALHDTLLMNYVTHIPHEGLSAQCKLARFLLNASLHEQRRDECKAAASMARPPDSVAETHDVCILVCAGGEKLMRQLYCNLKSLELLQHSGAQWGALEHIPIVVAHADEISAPEIERFERTFTRLRLVFFDLARDELVTDSRLSAESLRGFQIKLAAMVAVPARRVLMMDADLLWARDPRHIIAKCEREGVHAHLFRDLWHFVNRTHEKSSSTSFLYSLHGVDFDMSEFESGVVFFDRASAYRSVAVLRHMLINYGYYFSFTFGDKDLFYLALKTQGATITVAEALPQMLGCVYDESRTDREPGVFYSQSMVQTFDAQPSHIHTTLHPVGDEGFDVPTHLCEDGARIGFVQRRLGAKTVGTVACDVSHAKALDASSVYQHLYACALRDEATYT